MLGGAGAAGNNCKHLHLVHISTTAPAIYLGCLHPSPTDWTRRLSTVNCYLRGLTAVSTSPDTPSTQRSQRSRWLPRRRRLNCNFGAFDPHKTALFGTVDQSVTVILRRTPFANLKHAARLFHVRHNEDASCASLASALGRYTNTITPRPLCSRSLP